MPCENPKIGFLEPFTKINAETGEIIETYHLKLKSDFDSKHDIIIPCGKCEFCKNAKRKDWAVRLALESKFHKDKFFLTLTYNDENLPENGTLVKSDLQKFFKRLRKFIAPTKIKYFAVGEYGEKSLRSHYHAIIYGWKPNDLEPINRSDTTNILTSKTLERIWGKGLVGIGTVNYTTCAYVAKYILKKAYNTDKEFYEVTGLAPEFQVSSKNPAILKQLEPQEILAMLKKRHIILPGTKPIIARIPQYVLNLAKDFWRVEYNKFAKENQLKAKRKIAAQLKETDLNFWHNYKKNIQIKKQYQKRALQKSKNIF